MINEKNKFLTVSCLSGLLSAEIFISTGEWGVQMPPLTAENSHLLRSGSQGTTLVMLTCVWINGRVNNHDAGDLRRHRAHYDVTVMTWSCCMVSFPVASTLQILTLASWNHINEIIKIHINTLKFDYNFHFSDWKISIIYSHNWCLHQMLNIDHNMPSDCQRAYRPYKLDSKLSD